MDSTGLLKAFRSDVVDTARPYLWSDEGCWRYANDAYRMFVRLTGGVADFLSEACEIAVTAGEPLVDLHPSILRIMGATLRSTNQPVEVINSTDVGKMRSTDYGQIKQLLLDDKTGHIRYLVHGMQRDKARLVQVPEVDDFIDLHIYRTPLDMITGDGQELTDVAEDHHLHLLDWMKHLAYKKQDADTFNPQASLQGKQDFEAYCSFVKAEWERYKTKVRIVSYGGL